MQPKSYAASFSSTKINQKKTKKQHVAVGLDCVAHHHKFFVCVCVLTVHREQQVAL